MHAPDDVEPAEPASLHREIDDDDVRTMAAIEAIAGFDVARLEHTLDTGILQHVPAPLQHDRVIVNDQDAGHCACTGISMRTQVPSPRALSMP